MNSALDFYICTPNIDDGPVPMLACTTPNAVFFALIPEMYQIATYFLSARAQTGRVVATPATSPPPRFATDLYNYVL